MRHRRLPTTIALLLAFAFATQGESGCANTSSTPTGTSEEAPAGVNSPEGAGSAPKPQAHTQVFHGVGQKDLGTIVVPVNSTVSWTCASCKTAQEGAGANFIIENSSNDASTFDVNGLDETHGVSTLDAGTYHTVVVNTQAGAWAVRITPGE